MLCSDLDKRYFPAMRCVTLTTGLRELVTVARLVHPGGYNESVLHSASSEVEIALRNMHGPETVLIVSSRCRIWPELRLSTSRTSIRIFRVGGAPYRRGVGSNSTVYIELIETPIEAPIGPFYSIM